MTKTRWLMLFLVYGSAITICCLVYRWWVSPKVQEQQEMVQQQEKQKVLVNTGSQARHKYQVRLAADSFSGYALLRSPEFRDECSSRSIKLEVYDDNANYDARLKAIQSGDTQFAVFTIDALVKASAALGDMPGTIVAIIDESKGADAIIANKTLIPNIDALNNPDTKFVTTMDSPSETLARVVMAYFDVQMLGEDRWVPANGAKDVFAKYKSSKPNEKLAFCLWEPYVSRILESNSNYHSIIDSSKFRGYIVDVLVVSRDYLVKNESVVKAVVESYFRTNFLYRAKMDKLVASDSTDITPSMAKKMVDKIKWKNTQENYAHFGLISGHGYQHIEDMILNTVGVLEKTGVVSSDPTAGRPNVLYYDSVLRGMFDGNFHPGVGTEDIQNENTLAALTDEEWSTLTPVGTLQVPRLVFARGTKVLTTSSKETLTDLATKLKNWPQYYLMVRGHCSMDGNLDANKKLAVDRAQAAVDWLVENGVDKNRVKTDSAHPDGSTTVAFILGQLPY